ncbi:hypothetical protein [Gramella sp. AN32]|uniref:Lipoprotein n=2 Tax=Christiangramia antarctica TaxID=2058158 RepID=A0ABW5X6Q3_9FLAO|nr:hypothetical protein [Gramella sp. AN32]
MMKNIFKSSLLIFMFSISLISCRNTEETDDNGDELTETERLMRDPDNKVEVKDGGDKIKITKEDGSEIKIKKDDGEYKKKVDNADGSEYKLKIDDGEVKEKTDN